MPIHPGDPYTLQYLSRHHRFEAMRRAEQQRLLTATTTKSEWRCSVAGRLRRLADRLAPQPSPEVTAPGGC